MKHINFVRRLASLALALVLADLMWQIADVRYQPILEEAWLLAACRRNGSTPASPMCRRATGFTPTCAAPMSWA